MKMNRREILKLSAGTLVMALVSPFIAAQSNKSSAPLASELAASKVEGNISYNAGWVIPPEDKAGLLDLESKKTQERDDLAKRKAGSSVDSSTIPKDNSKSFSSRFQELVGKIKSFF
jgi:hypothetical protein